jgi:RNA polymerase sigma-70 factor (ECF subfamily)
MALDDAVPNDSTRTSHIPKTDVAVWFDDALPRLFGYFITRVGGRVAVAEDLTQETVLAAVATANAPNDPTSIMPWLYGIARHKLMDHYRKQERDRRHFGQPIPDDDDVFENATALPDLDLESLPVRDAVITALDLLPPTQRAALVIRYLDGCDVATTASIIGSSISATDSLLARARAAFRHHYLARNGEAS